MKNKGTYGFWFWTLVVALVVVTVIVFATGTPIKNRDAILLQPNTTKTFVCESGQFEYVVVSETQYILTCK